MAREVENRIFVGGLSWETDQRQLEDAFGRYGKILDAQLGSVGAIWTVDSITET